MTKASSESWLDETNPFRVFSVPRGAATRHAVTHYRVLKRNKGRTLVELTLETGRRHQIRVHLADAGCPVIGDTKYGAKTNPAKRLGASRLGAAAFRIRSRAGSSGLNHRCPRSWRGLFRVARGERTPQSRGTKGTKRTNYRALSA